MALSKFVRHNWIQRQTGILYSGAFVLSQLLILPIPAQAQSLELSCQIVDPNSNAIRNTAAGEYSSPELANPIKLASGLNQIFTQGQQSSVPVQIIPQGVTNGANGDRLISVGVLIDALAKTFETAGLTQSQAAASSILAVRTLIGQQRDVPMSLMVTIVKQGITLEYPAQTAIIEGIPDQDILQALTATTSAQLQSLGANPTTASATAAIARQIIDDKYTNIPDLPFNALVGLVNSGVLDSLSDPEKTEVGTSLTSLVNEIERLRQANDPTVQPNTVLVFNYLIRNPSDNVAAIQMPSLSTFQSNAVRGGTLQAVDYTVVTAQGVETTGTVGDNQQTLVIPAQGQLRIKFRVLLGAFNIEGETSVKVNLSTSCGDGDQSQSFTLLPPLNYPLIDPFGRITGCDGELLTDYRGFSVALFEPRPGTTEVAGLTPLTVTEIPDLPKNGIPAGLAPNTENNNPFFITNSDGGRYNFQFDPNRGQLTKGKQFILVVSPPSGSEYSGRSILVTIGDRTGSSVNYSAQSLDGKPIIGATDGRTAINGTIQVNDATAVGLSLSALQVVTSVCQPTEIKITKTGDRSVVEPGDTILYRLNIRNLASSDLKNIVIEDTLPRGIKFVEGSSRAEVSGQAQSVTTTVNSRTVTFSLPSTLTLSSGASVNLIYAAQVTPDALRGEGKNYALVAGTKVRGGRVVRDGPAIHAVKIDPGIIRNCGTLIGRVFVDTNFDGEQQEGEAGVPNAVIYLEDGNRIITDAEGLYSVANVLPGYHTGVLDLNSLPGYTLAPNVKFIESNSKSRAVNLPPGGMVRMNFAVTPTFNEEGK